MSWDFIELGKIRPEVVPPQVIRTVPHTAWQARSFHVPKALEGKDIKLMNNRIKKGILKFCSEPYRNLFFLVGKKKPREYRLINIAMNYNQVTI